MRLGSWVIFFVLAAGCNKSFYETYGSHFHLCCLGTHGCECFQSSDCGQDTEVQSCSTQSITASHPFCCASNTYLASTENDSPYTAGGCFCADDASKDCSTNAVNLHSLNGYDWSQPKMTTSCK